MCEERYREALRIIVADLRPRWETGAAKGDPYRLGFNAGLLNALLAVQNAAEDTGIDPAELALEKGWGTADL